jgi:uncharacterized iron-regulated membrane protein
VAQSTVLRLRGTWLSVHKWIGLCLAILIIPISITGAALVWDGWLDQQLNPRRYDVSTSDARMTPSQYADAARSRAGADDRLTSIRYPDDDEGGPVIASLTQARQGGGERGGPPQRTNVWIDPGNGRVLDAAGANSGLIRIFHNLHGNLLVPGWGRTIVGWVGVFMFISCLTGIWLWWPIGGSVRRGFRWKRQNSTNANIHHVAGFWILLPLAMLSFTGFWIAFPSVFGGGGGGGMPRPAPAVPVAATRLTPDAALAAAEPLAGNAQLTAITWPTDKAPEWKFAYARIGEIAVNDATGAAAPPQRAGGGPQRSLARRWHDGTGMGPVWQTIIFLGGIIPAIRSITGLVMWWRSRGWKRALAKRRREKALAAAE